MTKPQNTAYTQQINKLVLDHLYSYNLSTQPPSIQEIPKYNSIADKNTFKFHRISLHLLYTLKNKVTYTPNTLDTSGLF